MPTPAESVGQTHPAQSHVPRRRPIIARFPRWAILAIFWLIQGLIVYVVDAVFYASQSGVKGPYPDQVLLESGLTIEVTRTNYFGDIPTVQNVLQLLMSWEFMLDTMAGIAAITIGQALLLLPIRKPRLVGPRAHGVRSSMAVAAMAIGALVFGFAWALYEVANEYDLVPAVVGLIDSTGPVWWQMAIAIVLPVWIIATPLLIAFCGRGTREDVVARLARRLFLGTIIEVALLIPLDVMIRRKTSCYCWAGTYWALTICGFVGTMVLGPMIYLPLLSKRRKPWYAGHCGVCGYDMQGKIDAPNCPECGTGWRPGPAEPAE